MHETVGAAIHGPNSFIWLIAVHRCLQALTRMRGELTSGAVRRSSGIPEGRGPKAPPSSHNFCVFNVMATNRSEPGCSTVVAVIVP